MAINETNTSSQDQAKTERCLPSYNKIALTRPSNDFDVIMLETIDLQIPIMTVVIPIVITKCKYMIISSSSVAERTIINNSALEC